jgi:hypothetical protein
MEEERGNNGKRKGMKGKEKRRREERKKGRDIEGDGMMDG